MREAVRRFPRLPYEPNKGGKSLLEAKGYKRGEEEGGRPCKNSQKGEKTYVDWTRMRNACRNGD